MISLSDLGYKKTRTERPQNPEFACHWTGVRTLGQWWMEADTGGGRGIGMFCAGNPAAIINILSHGA